MLQHFFIASVIIALLAAVRVLLHIKAGRASAEHGNRPDAGCVSRHCGGCGPNAHPREARRY